MDRSNLTHKLQAWGQQLEHVRQLLTTSPAIVQMPAATVSEKLSTLEGELSAAQEDLCQQAEALQAGQQATDAARQRYQELFDFASDGYLVLNAEGAILEAIGTEDLATLRAGRVHVVEDILHLPAPPLAMQVLQQEGVRSYVRVPLLAQATLLGALNLWDDRPGAFTPEQVEIACEGADLLAVALQQARLREQVEPHAVELEQRVRERTAQLEVANKELEAFSYAVAHDLRSPLRAIHGFSQILLDDYAPHLDAEAQSYLQHVSTNALHMGRLIDTLLECAGLGRQPLAKQTVAPAALVKQVLDDLRPAYEHRQVEFTIGALPTCQGDPALLRQVWANLLNNALKFTRQRAVACIEVGCDERQGEWVYFVRDNAVGFEMQYADKLFGVFQRLHRAEDYEGTGVGLALTQRIVQRHGGRIWAEAEVDRGATSCFTLGA